MNLTIPVSKINWLGNPQFFFSADNQIGASLSNEGQYVHVLRWSYLYIRDRDAHRDCADEAWMANLATNRKLMKSEFRLPELASL